MKPRRIWQQIQSWIVGNWREAHVIFALLSVLFGAYFAFAVPVGYTHDESVHAFRAYQLQAGQFFSHPVQEQTINGKTYTLQGGDVANAIIDLEQSTGAGSRLEALCKMNGPCKKPSAATQKEVQANADRKVNPLEKSAIHTWGASYYFFLAYLPSAMGMQVAEIAHTSAGTMIHTARLGNVLAYAAIVGWAIYLLKKSRTKYIVFAVGLFPLSVSLSAGLGVDMLLIALSLVLFSLSIRAYQEGESLSSKLKIALLVTAILIPILKLPYILLSFIVLCLPVFGNGKKSWLLRGIVLVLILVPTLGWNIATADMVRTQAALSSTPGDTVNTAGQVSYIKSNPFDFVIVLLRSIFTQNWLNYMGGITQQGVGFPPIIYYFEIVPILVASYAAALQFKTKMRTKYVAVAIAGGAALAILTIFISLYVSYTPVGGDLILGVQGRYLLPALAFLLFGVALGLRKFLKPIPANWQKQYYIYGTYLLLLLACSIWYHFMVYVWV